MEAAELRTALDLLGESASGVAVYSRTVRPPGPAVLHYRPMPEDAQMAAQELFSVLRDFDARGVTVIWIEQPPAAPAWDGVRDRLQRAAAA
jgi:L-threonylcarbamoyladenylate synthase